MKQNSSLKGNKIIVPRITQLDANEFDQEIHKILYSQIIEISKYLKPGALNNVRSEIYLLINILVLKYSLIKNNATFGQNLLGLKYEKQLSKLQIILYATLNYFLPYVRDKYENSLVAANHNKVSYLVKKVELIVKVSQLLNLIFFLIEGIYPDITDRLLKLKYVPVNRLNRNVGYNFMTRQLLWHGFTELLVHILPLINYRAIQQKIKTLFIQKSKKYSTFIIHNNASKCVICNDDVISPCRISICCPHIACYYCIKSNTLANEKYLCPICAEPNTVLEGMDYM